VGEVDYPCYGWRNIDPAYGLLTTVD